MPVSPSPGPRARAKAAADAARLRHGDAPEDHMVRVARPVAAGLQLRKPRKCEFTPKKQDKFFEVLGETANMRMACDAAKVSKRTIFNWRRKDPAFARRWAVTLEEGYALLEMHLLGIALFGTTSESETQTDSDGIRRAKVQRQEAATALRVQTAHQHEVARIRDANAESAADALLAEVPEAQETLDDLIERLRALLTSAEQRGKPSDAQR